MRVLFKFLYYCHIVKYKLLVKGVHTPDFGSMHSHQECLKLPRTPSNAARTLSVFWATRHSHDRASLADIQIHLHNENKL